MFLLFVFFGGVGDVDLKLHAFKHVSKQVFVNVLRSAVVLVSMADYAGDTRRS